MDGQGLCYLRAFGRPQSQNGHFDPPVWMGKVKTASPGSQRCQRNVMQLALPSLSSSEVPGNSPPPGSLPSQLSLPRTVLHMPTPANTGVRIKGV